MASNDMNSWDEDPDELLRQRWQRTFANFEVQPRSSLSRRILNQVTAGYRRRPTLWVVGVGLLLLSAGLFYKIYLGERFELGRGKATTVRHATPVQPLSASRVRQPVTPVVRPKLSVLPGSDPQPDVSVAHQPSRGHQPTVSGSSIPGIDALGVEASARAALPERRAPTEPLVAGRVGVRSRMGLLIRTTSVGVDQFHTKLGRSVGTRFPFGSTRQTGVVGYTSIPVERSGSTSDNLLTTVHSSVSQPPARALPVVGSLLKSLGRFSLPSSLSALPSQLPSISLTASHPDNAVAARSGRYWFVDAVPLSSFQWMSAPPTSTAYVSQVDAPAAFSPATWGYQLNGGIRFQHWRAYLSLGQLRRWAYYTVNENRYRVEPSPTNPNHLVRETHTVAENVSLPMVGVGLSRERLLAQGRYAVEVGGQVSYLPTSDQTLIGLRGGASRRLAMSRLMELQIGLTAEYGLNRLLSEQRQLAIHPIVVGIGIRIQPRQGQ